MPRTLILEPTRELAAQVEEAFVKYGKNHKLNMALLIGGVSFDDQDTKLTRGVDVLIATPGRLLDHFEGGRLLLSGIEILVIDEADRMLDMGFIPDIERICKLTPFTRQTLFFSATMPPEIQRLVGQFLTNPVKVEVSRPASTVDAVSQVLVSSAADPAKKREVLRALIRAETNIKNGIIFCNRKTEVAKLHRSLVKHGFSAIALHGDMDQRSRTNALESFRKGEITLLIASDVAARGLDIPDVSHVFNFDVPHHAEDYVHRIGRTGRAGRSGAAFTITSSADGKSLAAIEKLIGRKIPQLDHSAAPTAAQSVPSVQTVPPVRPAAAAGQPSAASEQPRQERERRPQGRRDRPQKREEPRPRPESRERAPAPAGAGPDTSHLPAFLLRPVPIKAG
jgi:superfamily II DNA/RNA helicase